MELLRGTHKHKTLSHHGRPTKSRAIVFAVHAVTQNKVTEARVREMVSPLFYTRMRLGEFDPPEMNPYSKLSSADVETPDHKALAVKAAMKSFVLLKNNGVLPMNRSEFQKIAVVQCFVFKIWVIISSRFP